MPLLSRPYEPFQKDLDDLATRERSDRARQIEARRAYYYGNHKRPLPQRDQDSHVILNLCEEVIDKLTSGIGVPEWEVETPNAEPLADGSYVQEASAAQRALDARLERIDMRRLTGRIIQSGLISGHVFVRLVAGAEARPVLLDPRMVSVFWSEDATENERAAAVYRLEWTTMGKRRRQDMVRAEAYQGGSGWQIMEWEQGAAGWALVGQELWNYPFAPIIDWQSRPRSFVYYGEPDIPDSALKQNDAVNFVASSTAKIVKYHAAPKTIVAGGRLPDDVDVAPDAALEFSSPDTKVFNLEMASDLNASMRFLDMLRSAFFAERHVVDISTIKDRLGQLTNYSARMLYSDMLNRIEERREAHGAGLAQVLAALSVLEGGPGTLPVPRWPEALVADRAGQVATLERELAMGVISRQTAAAELGRDWVFEAERMAEEQNAASMMERAQLTAMAQVGQLAP
jgi:hypothetical protein